MTRKNSGTIRAQSLVMAASLLLLAGCGGSVMIGKDGKIDPKHDSGQKDRTGRAVVKAAAMGFNSALDEFSAHDKKQDWQEDTCKSVASSFLSASKEQQSGTGKPLAEAIYNAGLAYQRCGKDADARSQFEAAIRADGSMHRAKAQIALYDFQKGTDIDSTVQQLDTIIRDAKFQNAEALVALAALQMERGGDQPDQDGKTDLERAQRNLQRALAVDDSYMPAFNQLAIYYLELARAKSGQESGRTKGKRGRRKLVASSSKRVDVNEQQLDLAALVASQAQRKNPNYAPIHNTSGLIQVELQNFNGAVKSFGRARQLDPKFFEAHMNYAAVNLSFRGFQEAEKAYREALRLRPNEYEAHLGLALALRGQINDGNFDKYVAESEKELAAAKKIDGQRPEAYYNEAILTQEYKAKRGNAVTSLEKAARQYDDFVAKAGGDASFADAVKRAKERTQDIRDTIKFIKEGEQAAKDAPPPPPPGKGAPPPPDPKADPKAAKPDAKAGAAAAPAKAPEKKK
jgi:tetratricopeptide (TPR) repeat protein